MAYFSICIIIIIIKIIILPLPVPMRKPVQDFFTGLIHLLTSNQQHQSTEAIAENWLHVTISQSTVRCKYISIDIGDCPFLKLNLWGYRA